MKNLGKALLVFWFFQGWQENGKQQTARMVAAYLAGLCVPRLDAPAGS
jgi:hypothetical protein